MKQIAFSWSGQRADIGGIVIYRMLPNRYAEAIGPFVFLDHIAPAIFTLDDNNGTGAHPHRGIATFSYLFSGENEHFDSRGNHQRVQTGGIQWMKAGNGIVHDEKIHTDDSNIVHGVQFWINLPSEIKAQSPEYIALQPDQIPVFNSDFGYLKVLLGKFENLHSIIPTYLNEFIYHIHILPHQTMTINSEVGIEYAALLPNQSANINSAQYTQGDFVEFDRNGGAIMIENPHSTALNVLLFGGDPYTEPIVAEGPFVMNSHAEIGTAYRDFFAGKYGEIESV